MFFCTTMEGGLPMLNCLLQHTLRSLCSSNSESYSSRWVYAVFWRILPRNYPPPKWDHGGSVLDRGKGDKRNWILVWEDGFCDFSECERAGSGYVKGKFGANVFFKMSHEVYNYGEGLVGKVAADNSHKWVSSDSPNESDPSFTSSWNISIDPQPRAWEVQFNSGIQTIAIISVREGILQLGSLDKVVEDLNLVISIQRKFSYLLSIPGIYAIQRPYLPIQNQCTFKPNNPHMMVESNGTAFSVDDKRQLKTLYDGQQHDQSLDKSINFNYLTPLNGIAGPQPPPLWSIPPLLPSMSCNFRTYSSKLPSITPLYNTTAAYENNRSNGIKSGIQNVKFDDCGGLAETQGCVMKVEPSYAMETATHQETCNSLNPKMGLRHVNASESGFSETVVASENTLNIK